MNKQEAIEKLHSEAVNYYSETSGWFKEIKLDIVTDIVNQINEPEKPVLSKEEAEWLERLKKAKSFLNCLYIITRQGWGHDFEFYVHEEKYKLSYRDDNDEDSEQTKNRLVNALIYGYEVEKEKLYTAELMSTGEYLHYDIEADKIHHFFAYGNTAKNSKYYHFTKSTLIQYNAWGNDAYDVNEVEE